MLRQKAAELPFLGYWDVVALHWETPNSEIQFHVGFSRVRRMPERLLVPALQSCLRSRVSLVRNILSFFF